MALPAALQPDGALRRAHGIEVRITPGVPAGYDVELWRAPDNGSGSPNVGAAVNIQRLVGIPTAGASFIDLLAADGAYRHYRWRHVADGYDPGPYTPWARGIPTILPPSLSQGGLVSVYPIMRSLPLTDGNFAVSAKTNDGLQVVKEGKIEGQNRTLAQVVTYLAPNAEFDVWESASQPHA